MLKSSASSAETAVAAAITDRRANTSRTMMLTLLSTELHLELSRRESERAYRKVTWRFGGMFYAKKQEAVARARAPEGRAGTHYHISSCSTELFSLLRIIMSDARVQEVEKARLAEQAER